MELTLPLAAAQSLGERNLIGITAMCSLRKCYTLPAVICEIIAKGIELTAIIHCFPQVIRVVVVQANAINTTILIMFLDDDLAQTQFKAYGSAT